MALTFTSLTRNTTGTDATLFTSAVVAPASGSLVLAAYEAEHGSLAIASPAVAGLGLTWVEIASVSHDVSGSNYRVGIFRAMGTVTPGTITFDYGAFTCAGQSWSIIEVTGMDTSGTNGSGAIVQFVTGDSGTGATSLTITLAAFGSANNYAFGAFNHETSENMPGGSGFTVLDAQNHATPASSLLTEYKANSTTVDTGTVTASQIGGVAIEVKAASPVTSGTGAGLTPAVASGADQSVFGEAGKGTSSHAGSGASRPVYAESNRGTMPRIPFGPQNIPDANMGPPYSGTFNSSPQLADIVASLDQAKAYGWKVLVHLAGARQAFQNPDMSFSPSLFDARLTPWEGVIDPYIADGTIIGHVLIDEPQDASNWDLTNPVPYADIDAAAQSSKSRWPTMPTGVGSNGCFLKSGAPYTYLNFYVRPLTDKAFVGTDDCGHHSDTVTQWMTFEKADAVSANLRLGITINIPNTNGFGQLDATTLQAYGTEIVVDPAVFFLSIYTWDASYFAQADVAAAVNVIAALNGVQGLAAPVRASGADQTVFVETGTGTAAAGASGAVVLILSSGGTLYTKAGSVASPAVASGAVVSGAAGTNRGSSWAAFKGAPVGSIHVNHGEPHPELNTPAQERAWELMLAADDEESILLLSVL